MYDTGKILGGLIVFLVLATSPFWINALSTSSVDIPEFQAPPNGATECVEAKDYMRPSHMDLLNTWRDDVVRTGERYYTNAAGATYEMSLSRTCMDCHSNKAEFCDACHNYMAVNPYCWDCHVAPQEVQ
ncbi:MAG: menaquinol oxidoreductase [bacterium]|nr:menaquinol oxidoreductase [bacterium]